MKLTNKWYDALKYIVTIGAPVLITFISTLTVSGVFENTDKLIAVIGALATFIGGLIGVSSANYKKEGGMNGNGESDIK